MPCSNSSRPVGVYSLASSTHVEKVTVWAYLRLFGQEFTYYTEPGSSVGWNDRKPCSFYFPIWSKLESFCTTSCFVAFLWLESGC
jgi:hypothetical protein